MPFDIIDIVFCSTGFLIDNGFYSNQILDVYI